MIKFELAGADQLLKKMQSLKKEVASKHLRSAARRAMSIVRDRAKANAKALDDPNTAIVLADNIYMAVDRRRSREVGGVVVRVGMRGGSGVYGNTKLNRRKQRVGKSYDTSGETHHWLFLELGTEKMAARPFFAPALESSVDEVTAKFMTDLDASIERELAK